MEEEAIYQQVIADHLQATLWQAIKQDGRLVHRGPTGIKAHMVSTVG